MNTKTSWEIRNFYIYATLRDKPAISQNKIAYIPFKGTLPEAKLKAQDLLREQEGVGWKVVVESDGQTIYCTYDYPIEQQVESKCGGANMRAKCLVLSEGIKAIIASAEKTARQESIQPYCNKLTSTPFSPNGAEEALKEYNRILNFELNIFLPDCLEIAKEYYPKLVEEYEECLITKLEFMKALKGHLHNRWMLH